MPSPALASPARARVLDARAARLSQAFTGLLVLAALAARAPALVAVPLLHLLASLALGPRGNAVIRLFDRYLAPRLGTPDPEDPRPLRFANAVGATFLATALLLHAAGFAAAGWTAAGAVAALSLLAAATGLCVGCRLYWLVAAVRRSRSVQRGGLT